MLVRIGNKAYNSDKVPIALILAPQDISELSTLSHDKAIICVAPSHMDKDEIAKWMESPSDTGYKPSITSLVFISILFMSILFNIIYLLRG